MISAIKRPLYLILASSMLLAGFSGSVSAAERSGSGGLESSRQNEYAPQQQVPYNPLSGPAYPVMQDSYFTDDYGNILMTINVLGEVNKPGQLVVRENSDFPSIIALAGGVKNRANLTKVVVARKEPDSNGRQAYRFNLEEYYERGTRDGFIALKPNDTIIIPEKRGLSLDVLSKVAGLALIGVAIF